MEKIKSEIKNLINDIRTKNFTDRVKLFTAVISSVVLIAAFVCLFAVSNRDSSDVVTEEEAVVEEAVKEETPEKEIQEPEEKEDVTEVTETVDAEEMLSETEDAGEEYINETLFLGDSNTVRMMNYGITSLDNTFAVVGMGIQSVKSLKCIQFSGYSSPITMVDAVKLVNPRRIIITFGTNNANGMSVEDFISKYEDALAALEDASPNVDILINSIPPIAEKNSYPTLSQNSIDKFNNALIKMAAELGYKFIDSASVMKDSATGYAKTGYTVGDGIHISEDGFAAMFTYIRTHSHVVKDTTPRPETPLPKQVKATYVVDSNGKMNNDPDAYKKMSEVTKEEQEALRKAMEEATRKAAEEAAEKQKASCQHANYRQEIIQEATESSTGKIKYICNDCGYSREETIPQKKSTSSSQSHVHNYAEIERADAQPGKAGYVKYRCSCGETYTKTLEALPVATSSSSETPVTPPTDSSSETQQPGDTSSSETPATPPEDTSSSETT